MDTPQKAGHHLIINRLLAVVDRVSLGTISQLASFLDPRVSCRLPLRNDDDPDHCTADEIGHGEWVLGENLSTEAEIRERYHYPVRATLRLSHRLPPLTPIGFQPDADLNCELSSAHLRRKEADFTPYEPDRLKRHLDIARAELLPSRPGCRIHPFDKRAYIKRFLRSRVGMVCVHPQGIRGVPG